VKNGSDTTRAVEILKTAVKKILKNIYINKNTTKIGITKQVVSIVVQRTAEEQRPGTRAIAITTAGGKP
jgi:hypothetical protein